MLSTVDLLVLTSLDQLGFKLKILFSFFTKQATLLRRSTVLSLTPQVVFPALSVTLVFLVFEVVGCLENCKPNFKKK
jgi:hypothetical protein